MFYIAGEKYQKSNIACTEKPPHSHKIMTYVACIEKHKTTQKNMSFIIIR